MCSAEMKADQSRDAETFVEQSSMALNTISQESWNIVRTWLRTCISQQHSHCSSRASAHPTRQLPSRLIEVTHGNTARLCTIDGTNDNRLIEYLALSHRWGSRPPQMLTSSSETMLRRGVNISAFCRTFQDAIMVTKRLSDDLGSAISVDDSLCIVQDSIAVWIQESAIMGDIYQDAFCTLAVTAAEGGHGGLFFNRNSRRLCPCAISLAPKEAEKELFYCVDSEDWAGNISRAPLNDRAWVFQERLLSLRVLHFASNQLYWECSELKASEVFPGRLPHGSGEHIKQLLPFSGRLTTEQSTHQGRRSIRDLRSGDANVLCGQAHKEDGPVNCPLWGCSQRCRAASYSMIPTLQDYGNMILPSNYFGRSNPPKCPGISKNT
jgi:Heterokaryon incompatibility protein (HET)